MRLLISGAGAATLLSCCSISFALSIRVAGCTAKDDASVAVVVTDKQGLGKPRPHVYDAVVTIAGKQAALYHVVPTGLGERSASFSEVGWIAEPDLPRNSFSLLQKNTNRPSKLEFIENANGMSERESFSGLTCQIWNMPRIAAVTTKSAASASGR